MEELYQMRRELLLLSTWIVFTARFVGYIEFHIFLSYGRKWVTVEPRF